MERGLKSREFIRKHLRPAGGKLVKKDSTHHVYELPNGQRMTVPIGGSDHTEGGKYLMSRLRKLAALPPGHRRNGKTGGKKS